MKAYAISVNGTVIEVPVSDEDVARFKRIARANKREQERNGRQNNS